jgi:hypothetical protein
VALMLLGIPMILMLPPHLQVQSEIPLPRVSGVTLGDSRERVIKILGKPISTRPHEYSHEINENGQMIEMHYRGLVLYLADMGKKEQYKVLEIQVTKNSWPVGPNLRVGQSREAATRILPQLRLIEDANRKGEKLLTTPIAPSMFPDGAYLSLELTNNQISKITITSDVD